MQFSRRRDFFGDDLVSDLPWRLFVKLFLAEAEGSFLTLSGLAEDCGLPPSVARRWVKLMTDAGWIAHDGQNAQRPEMMVVRLCPDARKAMEQLMAAA